MPKIARLTSGLVLIRVDEAEEQDASGVYVQDEWVRSNPRGVVEAVAGDVKVCKVGDHVWFERYTSLQAPDDRDLRVCREDAIVAIYEND